MGVRTTCGQLVLFGVLASAGCESADLASARDDAPWDEGKQDDAQPGACAPDPLPEEGTYLSFGVYDDCNPESFERPVVLHDAPFSERAACKSTSAAATVALTEYRFATADDYDRARDRFTPLLGDRLDRYKRRFQWVHVDLAAAIACDDGTTRSAGWMSTEDVKLIVDKADAPASANAELDWPFEDLTFAAGQVVSGFGSGGFERVAEERGADGGQRLHAGIDVAVEIGTELLAAADGLVIEKSYNHRSGWNLKIRHDERVVSYYAHNEDIFVDVGDSVARGQRIATVGFGGNATLPHLHFGVFVDGTPVDPMTRLPTAAARPLQRSKGPVFDNRVRLFLGVLQVGVRVSSLRQFAEDPSGTLDAVEDGGDRANLALLGRTARADLHEMLRVQIELPFSLWQLSGLYDSPLGSAMLQDVSQAFLSPQTSRLALQGALMLLASENDGLVGLLGLIERWELQGEIDVSIDELRDLDLDPAFDEFRRKNQVHPE